MIFVGLREDAFLGLHLAPVVTAEKGFFWGFITTLYLEEDSVARALIISIRGIHLSGLWLVAVDAGSRITLKIYSYFLTITSSFGDINLILYFYMTDRSAAWNTVSTHYSLPEHAIAGMAVGFNLVFEHDNLITAICFASVVVNLLPYTLSRLDKVAGICNACIAGFTLLCFVLGLLISHPHTPVNMNAMFPKLSGESAYSLMALLGANIIVHNFYTHSAFVQVQRRSSHTLGSLFHDHLFSILFIFTGIYLVNYILLSSAADESSETVVMNFQDATELMHQIFTNPAGPIRTSLVAGPEGIYHPAILPYSTHLSMKNPSAENFIWIIVQMKKLRGPLLMLPQMKKVCVPILSMIRVSIGVYMCIYVTILYAMELKLIEIEGIVKFGVGITIHHFLLLMIIS
ncbi:hypothetical protein ACJX0J_023393, partial [Zea mays]